MGISSSKPSNKCANRPPTPYYTPAAVRGLYDQTPKVPRRQYHRSARDPRSPILQSPLDTLTIRPTTINGRRRETFHTETKAFYFQHCHEKYYRWNEREIAFDMAMALYSGWDTNSAPFVEIQEIADEIVREFVRCGIWLDMLKH